MSDINDRLIRSVVQGNLSEAQALLEQGADASTSGVKALGGCNTVLMWAATEGHLEIVRLLLDGSACAKGDRGAIVNAKMLITTMPNIFCVDIH
jgi:ankyrin repeat protein